MASRAILSIHCEPQETDACRRFGGVSVSISASHGRVQNSWRQAFRFIKLTSTAAYGVLSSSNVRGRFRQFGGTFQCTEFSTLFLDREQ